MSAIGGSANLQAVTYVKLEQASKHKMWMPTGRLYREGQSGEGRARRRSAPLTNRYAPNRSTGVGSTACRECELG